jgi:polysaccharide biosynthesis transport protein
LAESDTKLRLPSSGRMEAIPAQTAPSGQVVPWAPDHALRTYFDALRDHLLYYFEVRNLVHKPKLVAVTGCREKSGVSTVAAGLAASLSKTGEGNVLLIDMNAAQNAPHYFHKGELKPGLADALEESKRDHAMVSENLYVVSNAPGEDNLPAIVPRKFTHLMPKLKSSSYDYIIFDMPPVNQLSVTLQLARYMDMVFMVVEAEKNNRESVARSGEMLSASGANFSVVLNKTRNYLPHRLAEV